MTQYDEDLAVYNHIRKKMSRLIRYCCDVTRKSCRCMATVRVMFARVACTLKECGLPLTVVDKVTEYTVLAY